MDEENFRTFLVVNPRSAGGATGKRFERIAEQVRAAVGAFDHAFTTAPGHATKLTRDALDNGYEMVVGVGGDGTFNEVTDGFFERGKAVKPDAVMGLIPQGTGGDLRKTIGIETDPRASCSRLKGRKVIDADAGHLRFTTHDGNEADRAFINIASFGVGGRVVEQVNKGSKALGGKLSFMIGSVKALLKFDDQEVTLCFDDGEPETRTITSVAVCNGQYFGGGMWVAPKAKMDDGVFDVTIWTGFTLKDFAVKSRSLYNGTHLSDPRTHTLRCKKLVASSDEEVLLDVDGEQPGRLPATFRIVPGAIKIKV